MENAFIVEIFEPRNYLAEVVAYFRIHEGVPCFPNVCQRLEQEMATLRLNFKVLFIIAVYVLTGKVTTCFKEAAHLSAAELQENVDVVLVFKMMGELHHMSVLEVLMKLNFICYLRSQTYGST